MSNRNLKYWQKKASLMVEDYTPELQELMSKQELKELTDHIGTIAEKDYRNQLAQMEEDVMTEMTAREFTEQMMEQMLNNKLSELQGTTEDEEEYSEEEISAFLEYIQGLDG